MGVALSRRSFGVGAVAALSGLALAACSSSDGLPATQGSNYIEGDGKVVTIAADQRKAPVEFTGTTVEGTTVDLSQYRGKVVVLNTWFAGCAPCREEAPQLESVWQEYSGRNVQFLGINTYDTTDIAATFQRSHDITYPSILDKDSGAAMLALRSYAPQATPTTLVLDVEGRVAARTSGSLIASTLSGMLDDAGAAPATAPAPATTPAAGATPSATGAPA